MRDPESPRRRAARPPRPGIRSGVRRLRAPARRRAGTAAVLTIVAVVGALAFARLAAADAAPAAVPASDLAFLKEAARSCPALTPARLAGQIMGPRRAVKDSAVVASVGAAGWEAWAPWPGASPADHRGKITALAHQTCDLVGRLRVANVGGDPWQTAVAAGHVGLPAVVEARGIPASARSFLAAVAAAADWYGRQPQFGGLAPQTTAPAMAGGITTVDPTAALRTAVPPPTVPRSPVPRSPVPPTTTPPTTTAPPGTTTSPTTTPGPAGPLPTTASAGPTTPYDPEVDYQITNAHAGRVLELPGDDTDTRTGTPVQVWANLKAADQYWRIQPAPTGGYVRIVNASSGKALSVRDDSTDDFAAVDQVVVDVEDPGEQWQLRDAGDGAMWIVNRLSGKALDLLGDDLEAADGQQVDLWSLQTHARDQQWTITR